MGAQERLIWAERELRGERALRRGFEAECRRLLAANQVLRAELEATLPRSAGAPESGLRQSLSRAGRNTPSDLPNGYPSRRRRPLQGRKR